MATDRTRSAAEPPRPDRREAPPGADAAAAGADLASLGRDPALLAGPPRSGRGFGASRTAMLLGMQRGLGNQAVQRLLQRAPIDAPRSPRTPLVAEGFEARLSSAGGGRPLEPEVRQRLEPGLGADLSGVRVHTDAAASQLSRSVDAVAFTTGQDIFFQGGAYNPRSPDGLHLLAHEAVHTVQQAPSRAATLQRQDASTATEAAPAEEAPPAGSPDQGQRTTAQLQAVIAAMERIYGHASRTLASQQAGGGPGSDDPSAQAIGQQLTTVADALGQLRAAAAGGDEGLKLSLLGAFSPTMIAQSQVQADAQLEASPLDDEAADGGGVSLLVQEHRPPTVAAKSLHVSQPEDPAELEAERVAQTVVSGGESAVRGSATRGVLHRQGGAAAVAEGLIAFEVAGGAEGEAATGPPGWIVGAVIGLIIVGALAMAAAGNVADTGIMGEALALIAAGTAANICDALAKLMDSAKRAGDTERQQRIKRTQKAKGCRHSRHS